MRGSSPRMTLLFFVRAAVTPPPSSAENGRRRFAFRRHIVQQFRRHEARAVFRLEFIAQFHEVLRAHQVDIAQRAAGERRKAEPRIEPTSASRGSMMT